VLVLVFICLFPFIIFLQDLPAEVGKKLSDVGKNREILVQAFRSTASPAAYPGEGTDFWPNESQLIFSAPLEIARQSRS
jgi:hypothetical protein